MNALMLNINYDDGNVAYLNGIEVASSNAPATRDWNSQATQNHSGELSSFDFDGYSDNGLRNLFTLNGESQFAGGRLQVRNAPRVRREPHGSPNRLLLTPTIRSVPLLRWMFIRSAGRWRGRQSEL